MNTTELIEIARECGAYTVDDGVVTTVIFGEDELQQFAQRIEQPHLQRIAELEKHVEQLREALCRCQVLVKAYGEPETKAIVCKALEQTK